MKDLGIEILENMMYGYFNHFSACDFTLGDLYMCNPDFKAKVEFRIYTREDYTSLDIYKTISEILHTYNLNDNEYIHIAHIQSLQDNVYTRSYDEVRIVLTNQADLESIAGLMRIQGKWLFKKEITLPLS
ncbi:MAG: hypothetical protein IKO49_01610 [Bacilli bacterium]|nr:hypothetical protein [Clostridia bacterium]MBR4617997.1 hypothetical protein [Bacilli bacterium]